MSEGNGVKITVTSLKETGDEDADEVLDALEATVKSMARTSTDGSGSDAAEPRVGDDLYDALFDAAEATAKAMAPSQ